MPRRSRWHPWRDLVADLRGCLLRQADRTSAMTDGTSKVLALEKCIVGNTFGRL